MVFARLLDLFDNVVVEQVDEFTHRTDSMMREIAFQGTLFRTESLRTGLLRTRTGGIGSMCGKVIQFSMQGFTPDAEYVGSL